MSTSTLSSRCSLAAIDDIRLLDLKWLGRCGVCVAYAALLFMKLRFDVCLLIGECIAELSFEPRLLVMTRPGPVFRVCVPSNDVLLFLWKGFIVKLVNVAINFCRGKIFLTNSCSLKTFMGFGVWGLGFGVWGLGFGV